MHDGPQRKALIAGISGQDGAYLAKLLLDKGYEVAGTSRDAQLSRMENLDRLGIRERVLLESMSPVDFASVFQTLSRLRPDEIYNLSGQSSVSLSFDQPMQTLHSIVDGTLNLLEAIRILGVPIRLYNAGSGECFGETAGGVADETTPFAPRSPYAAAKAASHWLVTTYREGYSLFACNGILFNHESPLRPERFVTRKITAAAHRISRGSGEVLRLGNLNVSRDWGWAPDYVDAMWRMLQQDSPQDYVIATGRMASLREFATAAFEAVGLDWRDHVIEDPRLLRPTDLKGVTGDPRRAEQGLSWRASVTMPDLAGRLVESEAAIGALGSQVRQ